MRDWEGVIQNLRVGANLENAESEWETTWEKTLTPGWRLISDGDDNLERNNAPWWNIEEDAEVGTARKITAREVISRGKSRLDESGLISEMEKRGIGRPSTYSSIVETIQKRGYVERDTRKVPAEG